MLSVVEWTEMVESFVDERDSIQSQSPSTDVPPANQNFPILMKKGGAYHTIDLVESSDTEEDDLNCEIAESKFTSEEISCFSCEYTDSTFNVEKNLAAEVKLVIDEMVDYVVRKETFPDFDYDPEGLIENEVFIKIEGTCGKPHCCNGCLCSSLRGAFPHGPAHPTHCGQERCIFSCTCSERACGALNDEDSRYHDKSKRKKKLPNRFKDVVLGRAYRKVHARTIQDCEPVNNSSSNSEEEYRALSPPDSLKDMANKASYYNGLKVPNTEQTVREKHSWLPADRGGFTPSVKKTIQDRRLSFMRKTIKNEEQTLADVFVWCSQHNKYNCLCINHVYFSRTNGLLWRPSKKERYLAIKVMFEIMLKEPSNVVYEVFPYDTSRHSARTIGSLYDFSARNRDALFLMKRRVEIENKILSYSNGYVKFKKYVIIKQPTPVQKAIPWEEVANDDVESQTRSLSPGRYVNIVKTNEKMRVDVGDEDSESMGDLLDESTYGNEDDMVKREAEMKLTRRKRKMTMKMIQFDEERRREFDVLSDEEFLEEIQVEPPALSEPPPVEPPAVGKKKRGRKSKMQIMIEAAAAAELLAKSLEVSSPTIQYKDVHSDRVERRFSGASTNRQGLVLRRASDNCDVRMAMREPVPEVQLISCNDARQFEPKNQFEPKLTISEQNIEKRLNSALNGIKPESLDRTKLSPESRVSEFETFKSCQKGIVQLTKPKDPDQKKKPRKHKIVPSPPEPRPPKLDPLKTEKPLKENRTSQKRVDDEKCQTEEAIVCAPDLPLHMVNRPHNQTRVLKRKHSHDFDALPAKISRLTPKEPSKDTAADYDDSSDDGDSIFSKDVQILEPRSDGYPHMGLVCLTPGLGYVEVVEVLPDRIVIDDPTMPGLRHTFDNLLAANAWLGGFLRGKTTFSPPNLELRWILVMCHVLKAKRASRLNCQIFSNPNIIITSRGPALIPHDSKPSKCTLMRKMLSESPKDRLHRFKEKLKRPKSKPYVHNPKFKFVRRPSLAVNPKFRNRLPDGTDVNVRSFDSPDGCVTVERIPGSLLPPESPENNVSVLGSHLKSPRPNLLPLDEHLDRAVIKPLPQLTSIRHLSLIPNSHYLSPLKASDCD